ncbi:MAG: hypothetical protein L0Y56_06095 [Nitrospira sp.]|nr:hypothetical protein [Nitrospira sp.]
MSNKSLFHPNETYTEAGGKLADEAHVLARKLLKKYKDYPTREVVDIVRSSFDFQACFERVSRQMKQIKEASKRKGG